MKQRSILAALAVTCLFGTAAAADPGMGAGRAAASGLYAIPSLTWSPRIATPIDPDPPTYCWHIPHPELNPRCKSAF